MLGQDDRELDDSSEESMLVSTHPLDRDDDSSRE